MNVITKKSPTTTTAATSGTSYLSMMTSNVANNNNNNNNINNNTIKRRESSMGEDSGVHIDHDSTGKNLRSSITSTTNVVPSLSSSSISKTTGTTTAPNPRIGTTSTTMVVSSTLVPPTVDEKPSSSSSSSSTLQLRKDSNASSSGAFSDGSRSFGQEENSSDSIFSHTSPSSHLVIKCNVSPTNSIATPSVTLTPRVKVTVQQPSITSRPSRFDSSPDNIKTPSSSHLKTPTSNALPIMTTSTTSSAPEFSLSGASSIDDSDDLALYDQYLLSSHGRQSNPSPELRKKTFDDWIKFEQRYLPRSKSEINTGPTEQSQQQQQIHTSQIIKMVSK
ncbi:unnamed protein product [Adineta steineri]|uniref:Uncharacterized protein n=1 Tax=Adineta steineri TaxID=433720 RepID=A0A814GS57_9BILA|nr:unnamed protein product [Adineta steineri]